MCAEKKDGNVYSFLAAIGCELVDDDALSRLCTATPAAELASCHLRQRALTHVIDDHVLALQTWVLGKWNFIDYCSRGASGVVK
jgi:hypothetical protein